MNSQQGSSAFIPTTILCGAASVAAALMIGGVVLALSPRPAQSTAAYAAQTKLPCGKCHTNPAGGGPTNDFGKAYAANGHKVPTK